METSKRSKAIAVVSTALLAGSLFWLLNTKRMNSSLEAGLEKEKLRSESLLSEKLLLEKDIERFKDQFSSLKELNSGLNKLVAETSSKLGKQESEYNRMKKENLSFAQVKRQRNELQSLRSQLENELQELKAARADLEARNHDLNNTVASLQEKNRLLTDDLNRAMLASLDQSQIYAAKRNDEKLTVRAKRTKKLIASFEAPVNLKNVGFRILDPDGNVLNAHDGTTAFNTVPSEKNYVASTDPDQAGNKLQKVDMVFTPNKKLKTGVYTVEILNENLHVGSMKVKLK